MYRTTNIIFKNYCFCKLLNLIIICFEFKLSNIEKPKS